jgi:Protein of unknown function, DUF481
MPRPLAAVAAAAALVSGASSALAQVNVEALRADIDGKKLYLALQASVAAHSGNTEGVVASGGAFGALTIGPHLLFLKLQGEYAEFSGVPTITNAFAHARYTAHLLDFLYGEVFAQVEEDRFQRLALRQVDGVGLRFGIVQKRWLGLFVGTAWMLDWEKLDDQFVFGNGASWFAQRWSNYLSVTWKINGRARISDTLYVQPRFNAFSDLRLFNDSSFVMDIDKRFSIKIDCGVHHNTTPPLEVLPTDVDAATSLVLTL